MVITKTLPSEAAKVLDKGVRKMTPGIMTWYQYGEAVLHYMQQVRAPPAALRCLDVCLYLPASRRSSVRFLRDSPALNKLHDAGAGAVVLNASCVCWCRALLTSLAASTQVLTSRTTHSAASTSCCMLAATQSCEASRRGSGKHGSLSDSIQPPNCWAAAELAHTIQCQSQYPIETGHAGVVSSAGIRCVCTETQQVGQLNMAAVASDLADSAEAYNHTSATACAHVHVC
jgi:hypothetical protein